jgi:hypothetical protein
MVQIFEEEALISKELIEEINEPLYGRPEDFQRVMIHERSVIAGYDMRSYWNIVRNRVSGLELTTRPSVHSDTDAKWHADHILEDKLSPAKLDELEPASFMVKAHKKTRAEVDELLHTLDVMGDEQARLLTQAIRTVRAVSSTRCEADAKRITDELSELTERFQETTPWVVASSTIGVTIAARVVGFRQIHKVDGLPIIEPIVLSHVGKQRALLPIGYKLQPELFYFDQTTVVYPETDD